MNFQFRCTIPDEPPLSAVFVRSKSPQSTETSTKNEDSLTSILEKKLGKLASCPELWPRFSIEFDQDKACNLTGDEQFVLTDRSGMNDTKDKESDVLIAESPVTPANGTSAVSVPVHKPSICQFVCDESPQWSDSMATPPVTWRTSTTVTLKENDNESLESTVESHCEQPENCTSLAAPLEPAGADVIDIDEFLFGDASIEKCGKMSKEKGVARNLFSKSTEPTVNCHSEVVDQSLPSEQVLAASAIQCPKSVESSCSSTVGSEASVAVSVEETPAKRLKLELFQSGPVAQSTPLPHVHDRASPELFGSPHTNEVEAVDRLVKGDSCMSSKLPSLTSNMTPVIQLRSCTKPRRLSMSRAFAYPTNSQLTRCTNKVASHRYPTRLAKKQSTHSNAVIIRGDSLEYPNHTKEDTCFRGDAAITEPQVGDSAHTSTSISIGRTSSRTGCSLVRKRSPGGFKTPRPTRKGISKRKVDCTNESTASHANSVAPVVTQESCCGSSIKINDVTMTKVKPVIVRTDTNVSGQCMELRQTTLPSSGGCQVGQGLEQSTCLGQADHMLESIDVSEKLVDFKLSDKHCKSNKTVNEFDALASSVHIPDDMQPKSSSMSGQFKGFRTGSGKKISVSASSMAKAKQLIENVDNTLQSLELCEKPVCNKKSTGDCVRATSDMDASGGFCGKSVGFRTVSGKPITVSSSSMAKAKSIFESIQLNDSGIFSEESDHEVHVRNMVNKQCKSNAVSCGTEKGSMKQILSDRIVMSEGKGQDTTNFSCKMASGSLQTLSFQTAGAKPLLMSTRSLMKAKKFIEDIHENVHDCESNVTEERRLSVNLSDAEAKELAEACVADEVKSSEVEASCCDSTVLSCGLDLNLFTQKTSWEIQESLKALRSSSQDNDHAIQDRSEDTETICTSDAFLEMSEDVCDDTKDVTDHFNYNQDSSPPMRGLVENNVHEVLLTDSLFQSNTFNASISQSSLVPHEMLQKQSDNVSQCKGNTTQAIGLESECLLDKQQDNTALDDSTFNKALISEPLVIPDGDCKQHVEEDYETTKRFHSVFVTGLGQGVGVTESALQLARQQLDKGYSSTATNLFENHSHQSHTSAEFGQSDKRNGSFFPCFTTAAGKNVEISDEALCKAKAMLNETLSNNRGNCDRPRHAETSVPVSMFSGFQTSSGQDVSVSQQTVDDVKCCSSSKKKPTFAGFQTASGRDVVVSEEALKHAKMIFSDDENTATCIDVSSRSVVAPTVELEGHLDRTRQNSACIMDSCETNDAVVPQIGFHTVAGAVVPVSDNSVRAAKLLLNNDQGMMPSYNALHDQSISHPGFFLQPLHKATSQQTDRCSASLCDPITTGSCNETVISTGISRRNFLKPLRTSSTAMANDCRTSLGAVGRRPIHSVSQRDCLSTNNFRWSKTQNSSFTWNAKLPVAPQDASLSCSVFTYPPVASSRGETVKNRHHTPFVRCHVPNFNNYKQQEDVGNEQTRQAMLKSSFKTPYKTRAEPTTHHAAAVSDTSLCQTEKHHGSFLSVLASMKSNVNVDLQSQTFSDGKASTQTEELKTNEVKADAPTLILEQCSPHAIVKPCIGYWLRRRLENVDNLTSLRDLTRGQLLRTYSRDELLRVGIHHEVLTVSSSTACDLRFNGEDHFSRTVLTGNHTVRLRDGGKLQLDNDGMAGVKEFIKVMSSTPGVDTKLINDEWIRNHYRWIVWKLAAMEVAFPSLLAGRCLTPECVASQLKYRYDREVDRSERSCLKKIFERDDVSSRLMVLCVAGIKRDMIDNALTIVKTRSDTKGRKACDKNGSLDCVGTDKSPVIIELTDGWYSIPAEFDQPLLNLVKCDKIAVGTKLCIYGAELCGLTEGCPPLEAPASVFLRVHANSTRRAVWYAKLGYQSCSKVFPVSLSSINCHGGLIGCIDVVIQRKYPLQWMERTNGTCVFRTTRAEERIARRHDEIKQRHWEAVCERLEKDMENKWKQDCGSVARKYRALSSEAIADLESGEDIADALQQASDPATVEAALSASQLKMLEKYRQQIAECKHGQLQKAVSEALAENGNNWKDRSVVAVLRLRVSCCFCKSEDTDNNSTVLLSVWRPSEELVEMLAESRRFRIFNLKATSSWFSASNQKAQLSTSCATRYQEMKDTSGVNNRLFHPRMVVSLSEIVSHHSLFRPSFQEFDTVGIIVAIKTFVIDAQNQRQSTKAPTVVDTVYLADDEHHLLAVKFWGGILDLAIDCVVHQKAIVAMANLRWRGSNILVGGGIPSAKANEFTLVSSCPKEKYLQIAIEKLRSQLPANLDDFICSIDAKISKSLLYNQTSRHHSVHHDEMDADPEIEQWAMTADLQESLQEAGPVNSRNLEQRNNLLDRVPSPPPLASLPVSPSGAVCQEFKAPQKLSQ